MRWKCALYAGHERFIGRKWTEINEPKFLVKNCLENIFLTTVFALFGETKFDKIQAFAGKNNVCINYLSFFHLGDK